MTRRDHALWPLLAVQALLTAGLALSYPFFALYLHRDRGVPMGWVGFWLFVTMLAGAGGTVVAGELTDRRGPRKVMSAALFGRSVLVAALAWAIWKEAHPAVVVALHVVGSFVGHFFDPAIRSWIASGWSAHERVALYGRQRVAVNLGWAVGPAVGGLLAAKSYAATFGATALACAASGALALSRLPADAEPAPREKFSPMQILAAGADRRFLRYCLWCLVLSSVMSQLVAPLSVHGVSFVGLSERQVGALFTLNGVLVILGVIPASSMALKMSTALALGSVLYAFGYAAVGFASGFLSMALGVAVVTLGEIVVSPRLPSLAANLAPEGAVGRYMGFQGLCFQAGSALGPLLGGAGLQYFSPRWAPGPWLLVGALGAAAAAGFARFGTLLSHTEEGRPA